MPSPPELSLDCKPHSYSMLLKSFVSDHQVAATTNNTQDQHHQDHHHSSQNQLEDLLSRLEAERLKIDAFKRELPLCMQLLTNALETSRQQLQGCRVNSNNIDDQENGQKPILEEFIPLKQTTSEGSESLSNISDKANWMTSAQLWSQTTTTNNLTNDETKPHLPIDRHHQIGLIPKLQRNNNHHHHNNGGAFLPFSKDRILQNSTSSSHLPDLALAATSTIATAANFGDNDGNKCGNSNHHQQENGNLVTGKVNLGGEGQIITSSSNNNSNNNSTVVANNNNTTNSTNQTHRKARRCWSPDLHRRFVNALQMLGGSQVATPKQIRELMKVDGLTNDEVKSHLQKYRLHTRRPSPSPQAAGAPAPQLVVLGGIWVPPEYATAAAAAAHGGAQALYGPHPTTYCAPPVHQDFYPPPPLPHHQLHHQHALHQQLHMYKAVATAQAHSSPESDGRGNGDRSESIEDGGKSESGSWKVESGGENNGGGGERKGNLAALRQETGDESNGSEITLKF
ncbi:myb family transcription factor EFM [Benincasa hispida]|uniref:myb family transcription factor EFM n=1 Tax=Benincasa hispida TaxID=102211 RepID=UPI0019013A39|nr:myb family transcription factor EFM [Benincasa hispida]